MARSNFRIMPAVTDDDVRIATGKQREVVAFSARNKGQLLFLKLAFRKGDMATIYVDPVFAGNLLHHLKALFGEPAGTGVPRVKWAAVAEDIECGYGHPPD